VEPICQPRLRLRGNRNGSRERSRMANHLDPVRRASEALQKRESAVDEARETLRQRIIEAARAGESRSAIARAAGVSRQWISRLLETG